MKYSKYYPLLIGKILKLLLITLVSVIAIFFVREAWLASILIPITVVVLLIEILILFEEVFEKRTVDTAKDEELKISATERIKAEEHRLEQRKFQETQVKKRKKSERLLGKIIDNGLVREEDILAAAKIFSYFQVIVYSYSYNRILNSEEIKSLTAKQKSSLEALTRKYPDYLKEMGFVRVGTRSSTVFIISKRKVHSSLNDINRLKRHLVIEFERVRLQEWNEFIDCLKSFRGPNRQLYDKYQNALSDSMLPINFLLTESFMNKGNIGVINEKSIGIAPAANNRLFSQQLLSGTRISKLKVLREKKVAIRDFFQKIDISFLLEEIDKKTREKLDNLQDNIFSEFNINFVLELSRINKDDLKTLLSKNGVKNQGIADRIIHSAKEYDEALHDLNIHLA